jgi:hypothetical protein
MAQEIPAFLGAECLNDATDPAQPSWNSVLDCLAQMRPQFAEGQYRRRPRH